MSNLTRRSRTGVAVFLLLASASFLADDSHAGKLPATTAPQRGFYLTKERYDGSQPLTACATGYHMASIWEIHEPSNLRYDESLGFTQGDGGPPSGHLGWIRFGLDPDAGVRFRCEEVFQQPWTSNSPFLSGAAVSLIHPFPASDRAWEIEDVLSCDLTLPVWCVQD
jgi:hypothetical protein